MRFGRGAISVCLAGQAYRPRVACPRSVRHKPAFGRNSIPHELATPEAFLREPELIWRWYRWRRELVAKVEPNAGHRALVDLASHVREFTLITQNVDGLHQRAGSDSVIEFHGNIFEDRCFVENCVVKEVSDVSSAVPTCAACGGAGRIIARS